MALLQTPDKYIYREFNMKISDVLIENTIVDARHVLDYVSSHHGRPEDFDEGDLVDRINKFDTYEKKVIDIGDLDLDEWEVDEDYVEDLMIKIKKDGYEPIVFDPDENSIIDGIHRSNALNNLGYTKIKAYVGKDLEE